LSGGDFVRTPSSSYPLMTALQLRQYNVIVEIDGLPQTNKQVPM